MDEDEEIGWAEGLGVAAETPALFTVPGFVVFDAEEMMCVCVCMCVCSCVHIYVGA